MQTAFLCISFLVHCISKKNMKVAILMNLEKRKKNILQTTILTKYLASLLHQDETKEKSNTY